MLKKTILAITFCAFACASSPSKKDYTDNSKSVVVVRVSYNEGDKTKHYSLDENVWVQYDQNEKRTGKYYEFGSKIKAYPIEPGIYYLDTFKGTPGNKSFSKGVKNMDIANWLNRQFGSNPTMIIKHFKFVAEPGEAVYVGDIIFNVNNANDAVTWEVIDRYEEALLMFKEKHPNINKELKKRLAVKTDPISVEQSDYEL